MSLQILNRYLPDLGPAYSPAGEGQKPASRVPGSRFRYVISGPNGMLATSLHLSSESADLRGRLVRLWYFSR
jgi:hypothetical protein